MRPIDVIDRLPREERTPEEQRALLATCARDGCLRELTLHSNSCPLAPYNRARNRR